MGIDRPIPEESGDELYEGAPCGYLTTEPDGTILRVNRTFVEWTGHGREALVGRRRLQELLTPGGQIYHETHYAPLLRMQGSVREIAVDMVKADGSRLPVLMNSVLSRSASGEPELIRTTVFDATDRREYERELRRARDREQAARERLERLQRIGAALASAPLRRDAVAGAIVAELERQLPAGRAAVALADGGGGLAPSGDAGEASLAGAALERALHGGEPVFVEEGSGVLAAVPMLTEEGPAGVLAVRFPVGSEPDEEDRGFLVACARQCAHALEHARLYEEERGVAETLQRSLLAANPPLDPRFRVATHYGPGVDALEVGGDWFDVFRLDGDRVAVTVGDVVGRGLDAATAMGQLRSAVRALALADPGPSALIGHLDSFVEQAPGASVATLVYAEVGLDDGCLRFACAGHPPPVLSEPGSEPRLLWDGRSEPLGARVRAGPRAESALTLAPGSRMLLYTDGLIERRERPFDDGLQLLLDAFGARAPEPPASLVPALTAAMRGDGAADDDVCLLCFELASGARDG